jgi:hypothetical protein
MFRRLCVVAAVAAPLIAFIPPAAAATPTADSGPDIVVAAGTDAVLAGTAADADGDPLQIMWLMSAVSGGDVSSCTFTGPLAFAPISAAGLAPTLNCSVPGAYLLQLVAADGTSSFDDVGALITFTPVANHDPIVNSGPSISTVAGTDAVLAGSASDPDGDPLEIYWLLSVVSGGDLTSCTLTGPTSFTPISVAGLAPTLTCTTPGQYLMQLVATDGITSVDDIGALVTFTDPPDLTAPRCSPAGRARAGSFVIRVADPESGVATIRRQGRINVSVLGGNATFSPPTASANVTVTQLAANQPGLAVLQVVNRDDVSRICVIVVQQQIVRVFNL